MKAIEEKLGKKIKKPVCAYSLFVQEKRGQLKDKYPEMHHVEIMKTISMLWKNLDSTKRQGFIDRAQYEKARYESDRQLFIEEFTRMEEEASAQVSNKRVKK